MMDQAPKFHKFKNADHQVSDPKSFFGALKKEVISLSIDGINIALLVLAGDHLIVSIQTF